VVIENAFIITRIVPQENDDSLLSGASFVVIDNAHERELHTDFLLSVVKAALLKVHTTPTPT
jgi:HrpA-like RNA helicase